MPSIQPLVAKWSPEPERNIFSAFISSGCQMGTILGTVFSGLMADALGWQIVFYVEGCLAVLVVTPWLFFVYDSPAVHPRITREEKDYIEQMTRSSNTFKVKRTQLEH